MSSRRLRGAAAVAGLIAAIAVTGLAADRLRAQVAALGDAARDPREHLYVPGPSVILRASLGYRELTADLLWIRALVYFGQYFDAKHDVPWLEHYIDDILTLTPHWNHPYRWGANVVTFQTGVLTEREARLAASYFERGLREFPDDGELMFQLAALYMTDLKPKDDAEAKWLKLRAADLMARAARQPGRPAFWTNLAAKLFTQGGQRELAIAAVREQLLSTDDKERREVYLKELAQLESAAAADQDEAARARFFAGWKATLPYAPDVLYVLTAERPGVDLGAPSAAPWNPASIVDDPLHPVTAAALGEAPDEPASPGPDAGADASP